MNRVLELSVRTYRSLLLLYPEDLRRDFGDEMVLAFVDDLDQAWIEARLAGVARIWRSAIAELVTVALPGQQSNPCILVPALSFLFTLFTQGFLAWAGMRLNPQVDSARFAGSLYFAILLSSTANALVALVVTRFYGRCSINVLRLE
jgi:hypothetical protein